MPAGAAQLRRRHAHQIAPANVTFKKGAIIENQRAEQRPLGHDHTFASDAFLQLAVVLGCTGSSGFSCSTKPQLLSAQVPLPVADGGSHS